MADTELDTSAWGKQYHSYGENGILDGTYEAGTEPDKEASPVPPQPRAALGTSAPSDLHFGGHPYSHSEGETLIQQEYAHLVQVSKQNKSGFP